MKPFRSYAVLSLALAVLTISGAAFALDDSDRPSKDLLAILKGTSEAKKFEEAFAKAGLSNELTSRAIKSTVFAPSNKAMENIPSDVLKRIQNDKEEMAIFLHYHIAIGRDATAETLKEPKTTITAATGENIEVTGAEKSFKVNGAEVIEKDIMAQNGVIHVIDKVLVSPLLKKEREKAGAAAAQPVPPPPTEKAEKESPAQKEDKAEAPAAPVPAPVPVNPAEPAKKSLWQKLFGR